MTRVTRSVGWVWAPLAALALASCVQDAGGDSPRAEVEVEDVAVTADGALDAAPAPVDAAPVPDASPIEADADGPTPRCAEACERLLACIVERCEEATAAQAAAAREACATRCDVQPALASVVLGSETCQTVVDFGRDALGADLEACDDAIEPPPLPEDIPCRFPCEAGERCLGGNCVRGDGSCVTDYHCRPGQQVCEDGGCVPGEFAPCRGDGDCHAGHACRFFDPDPLANGTCIIPCAEDRACPFAQACNEAFGDLCYFEFCGPGTGNGTLYEGCEVGAEPGTCYPLARGSAAQGQPGYCIEGGTAARGAVCDAQADERSPASAAQRCLPGTLCIGDPDDPADPHNTNEGRGACSSLCDPRAPSTCTPDEVCVDFSTPDDPTTAFDEALSIGACFEVDCDLVGLQGCPAGEVCRVVAVTTPRGRCGPAGDVPSGAPCADQADCAGRAVCGGDGRDPMVCVADCDLRDPDGCPPGLGCYAEDGWAVGFCIWGVPPPPPPPADAGVEDAGAADAGPIDAQVEPANPDSTPPDAATPSDAATPPDASVSRDAGGDASVSRDAGADAG